MRGRSRERLRRLRTWLRAFDFALARRFGLATRDDRIFFILIALIGVVGGLLGFATQQVIDALQALLWGRHGDILQTVRAAPRWMVVAVPALGGALVGLLLWLDRRPEPGEGIGSIIEAIALQAGKIAPRPVLVNAAASVVTVASGGSLGREGPMIRLGAMVSSWLGQRFGVAPHRLKILVGCGAAAGFAATYNIPIGGTLFAMEVILGNFALEIFGPIVASSVIATVISRSLSGNAPLYAAPGYKLESGWELLLYAGLGVVGAVAAVAFVLGVGWGGRLFARATFLPRPLKPLAGMALLGGLGLYVPYALGRGYSTINLALAGNLKLSPRFGEHPELTIVLLLGLAAAKLVATALTRGSGGAGG